MTVSHTGPPLTPTSVGAALGALRANGLRASSPRRLLLEALFASEEPLSAERIATMLGGDLASVYRNLETLERLGIVRHFHLVHGPGLYTLAGRERDYLVCERCGAVRPVMPGALDDVREAVRRRFGLVPRFAHYPLVGLCEDCA